MRQFCCLKKFLFQLRIYSLFISDLAFVNQVATFVRWGYPEAQEVKTDLLYFLDFTKSSNRFILNQAAAKDFGWTDPVGKRFGFDQKEKTEPGVVVGVVRDFNYSSLRLPIEPLAISIIDEKEGLERGWLSIKVKPENLNSALAFRKQTL